MYYQNYEDYMRSILGYPVSNCIGYAHDTYNSNSGYKYEYLTTMPRYSSEILELYPEIYKIINPMVCKICEVNTKPITKELIEQMTDEIYLNIESETTLEEDIVNVRVNLPKKSENVENKESRLNQKNQSMQNTISTSKKIKDNRQESKKENMPNRENRQIGRRRNNTLRDLIQILILNQLLGQNRPNRPNFPPRPPYPGGQRPPIMPRNIYNNL